MEDFELFRSETTSWNNIVPWSTYSRRSPNLFNFSTEDPSLRDWFLREVSKPSQAAPPQDIYQFNNALVHDIAVIFHEDGRIVKGSGRDHNPIQNLSELNGHPSSFNFVPGLSAYIFKAGKDNYGHMLIEMLPKLELLIETFPAGLNIIVPTLPPHNLSILKEVNRTIYQNRFNLIPFTHSVMKCEQLIVPGPVTRHNSQKSSIVERFCDKIATAYAQGSAATRKTYISRRMFGNRRLTNEHEVEEIFRDRGFDIVFPEKLDFTEQVRLFSESSFVAGTLGAGLTNICFSPKDARVAMIDHGMFDMFFYDLANLRQQEFSWIFTKPLEFAGAARLHQDWSVDSTLIRSALQML